MTELSTWIDPEVVQFSITQNDIAVRESKSILSVLQLAVSFEYFLQWIEEL